MGQGGLLPVVREQPPRGYSTLRRWYLICVAAVVAAVGVSILFGECPTKKRIDFKQKCEPYVIQSGQEISNEGGAIRFMSEYEYKGDSPTLDLLYRPQIVEYVQAFEKKKQWLLSSNMENLHVVSVDNEETTVQVYGVSSAVMDVMGDALRGVLGTCIDYGDDFSYPYLSRTVQFAYNARESARAVAQLGSVYYSEHFWNEAKGTVLSVSLNIHSNGKVQTNLRDLFSANFREANPGFLKPGECDFGRAALSTLFSEITLPPEAVKFAQNPSHGEQVVRDVMKIYRSEHVKFDCEVCNSGDHILLIVSAMFATGTVAIELITAVFSTAVENRLKQEKKRTTTQIQAVAMQHLQSMPPMGAGPPTMQQHAFPVQNGPGGMITSGPAMPIQMVQSTI